MAGHVDPEVATAAAEAHAERERLLKEWERDRNRPWPRIQRAWETVLGTVASLVIAALVIGLVVWLAIGVWGLITDDQSASSGTDAPSLYDYGH